MAKFRIFVNNQRVATCVVLKDKSYYQVFPVKKVFCSKARWVEDWVDKYDSLHIVAEYPQEEDDDTVSDADSTSISEEETESEESESESETEEESETDEEEMVEWQPNSYRTNNNAYDWLMERLWSQGVRVQVPAHDHC